MCSKLFILLTIIEIFDAFITVGLERTLGFYQIRIVKGAIRSMMMARVAITVVMLGGLMLTAENFVFVIDCTGTAIASGPQAASIIIYAIKVAVGIFIIRCHGF